MGPGERKEGGRHEPSGGSHCNAIAHLPTPRQALRSRTAVGDLISPSACPGFRSQSRPALLSQPIPPCPSSPSDPDATNMPLLITDSRGGGGAPYRYGQGPAAPARERPPFPGPRSRSIPLFGHDSARSRPLAIVTDVGPCISIEPRLDQDQDCPRALLAPSRSTPRIGSRLAFKSSWARKGFLNKSDTTLCDGVSSHSTSLVLG